MQKNKNQHVLPHGNKWAVKGEGNSRNTKLSEKKSDAVDRAREIARNKKAELVVHNRDGKISDKDSYGNDPHPPKDKKN